HDGPRRRRADAHDRRVLPLRSARRLRDRGGARRRRLRARDGRGARVPAAAHPMIPLVARATALAVAAFVIVGPLASLGVWSVAERWTAASAWPQRFGLKYWSRMLTGDFLEPLRLGVAIALVVTALALL